MDWIFNDKYKLPILLVAFVSSSAMLTYEMLKTPDPNNPIGVLDKFITLPSLVCIALGSGIGFISFLLQKRKQ